ncbi:hypothetical protein ARSEF4850_006357 [Beauveria asiatica]
MLPRTTKYSPVNDGSRSPRESLSLDQMDKMSCAERMRVSGQTTREKGSALFNLTAPWLVSVVLAFTNLLWLWASVKQQRPPEIVSHQSWMPPDIAKPSLFELKTLYGTGLSNESETAWNALMPGMCYSLLPLLSDARFLTRHGHQSAADLSRAKSHGIRLPPAALSGKCPGACRLRHPPAHQQNTYQYMTREGYYSALEGKPGQVSSAHLMHCFDYLRQAIMCFSDTTLEWLPAPPRDTGSTGWGFEHKCRDFDAISRWVEDNRLKTTHGIH